MVCSRFFHVQVFNLHAIHLKWQNLKLQCWDCLIYRINSYHIFMLIIVSVHKTASAAESLVTMVNSCRSVKGETDRIIEQFIIVQECQMFPLTITNIKAMTNNNNSKQILICNISFIIYIYKNETKVKLQAAFFFKRCSGYVCICPESWIAAPPPPLHDAHHRALWTFTAASPRLCSM